MAAAAARHGVEFRYRTEAARIETRAGRAVAVQTADGDRIPAASVIVNADLPDAYRNLVPGAEPRRVSRIRYSPSCVVLHLGTATPPPAGTAHHTIGFGREWRRTFREIIDDGAVMSDPSFLLSTPTLSDSSSAPAGRHVHFVLFPAPNLSHRDPLDWNRIAGGYRDHMLDTLQQRGFPDIDKGIEVEHLVTPADWQRMGLSAGTPFAAAHTFGQTGPFRLVDASCRAGQRPVLRGPHPARRGDSDGVDLGPTRRRRGHPADPTRPIGAWGMLRRELDAAGITSARERSGFARARALNAAHGRTYYLATLLLPAGRRPFVHALYGFARQADDIVDGSDRAQARFEDWSAQGAAGTGVGRLQ